MFRDMSVTHVPRQNRSGGDRFGAHVELQNIFTASPTVTSPAGDRPANGAVAAESSAVDGTTLVVTCSHARHAVASVVVRLSV
jgi:hypothetical protein